MANNKINTDPTDFSFSTSPEVYRHISLRVAGDEATIVLQVDAKGGLRPDTALKLNSYDLSVDIELADAINRLRFEHPLVRVVTVTSSAPVFSSGANIYMLKKSSHAFKVNFCKFTNETRLYLEEASKYSNKKFLCALNGTAAGGGYELALACDRIILMDDKNANVSLPEVPLLGVLPGTGGLTRLTDKRMVRRDLADVFCTLSEGVKGQKAKDWRLVDEIYAKSQWAFGMKSEIDKLKGGRASQSTHGIRLDEINPKKISNGFSYRYVTVILSGDRVAQITVRGPEQEEPNNVSAMLERGADLWLIRAFRELDDAILRLRFFHREHGLWLFQTIGDENLILNAESALYPAMHDDANWFLREILLQIGRVFKRIDVSSRSTLAIVDEKSCFVGVLAELLLAADRSYGLLTSTASERIKLSLLNNGLLPTWTEMSRLKIRLLGYHDLLAEAQQKCDASAIELEEANRLGLITFVLDEIDFHDELRVFKEEHASLSPDALSAMEANLRFPLYETMASRIFGRLSAWQNWVFIRDNATGERGALVSYGEERRPQFDWERC
ncbi:MAG TPA: enoyl-CoA hydratase-related protein [Myxococcota bacterium]|nr:enoyl-CoA hydratase-related protein [Myxococcota bacterium]